MQVVGDRVVLIPYRRMHVEKYHNWMLSSLLLEQTASEPLTLEEEYEMQQKWYITHCFTCLLNSQSLACIHRSQDSDKCTFIILRKGEGDDIERMVGDVNFFLNDHEDRTNAEIEIMIANEPDRRKGYAREALLLMMNYGIVQLNTSRYYAKINETNVASIKLFLSLGYNEVNYVHAFNEYEYELKIDNCMKEIIQQQTADALYTVYNDE